MRNEKRIDSLLFAGLATAAAVGNRCVIHFRYPLQIPRKLAFTYNENVIEKKSVNHKCKNTKKKRWEKSGKEDAQR